MEEAETCGAKVVSLGTKHRKIVNRNIAKRINQKFVVSPDDPIVSTGDWYFDFAGARNHATEFADHDMVLHIDTGDILEVLDWKPIAVMISKGVTRFTYWHYLGIGTERQLIARFYDRRIDYWKGISHEALTWNAKPANYVGANGEASVGPQSGERVDTSVIQVRYFRDYKKPRPYFIGMALDCMADPNSPRWYHYLGREMYYNKKWRSALKLLLHQTEMKTAWKPEKSQSWVHAGECYEGLNDFSKAMECYWKAHTTDPTRREPLIRLADLHRKIWIQTPQTMFEIRNDCCQAAVSMCKAAMQIPNTTALSENEGNYREFPHDHMYWALSHLGKWGKAKYHCKKALQYMPHNERYKRELKLMECYETDSDTDLHDDEI